MPRPFKRLRWTLEVACAEFDINTRTLSSRLKQEGIDPDKAGHWTTKQIVRAIYNDLEAERIRKTRAEADQVQMQNRITAGDYVHVETFCKKYEVVAREMVRIIKSSTMTEEDQRKTLLALAASTQKGK